MEDECFEFCGPEKTDFEAPDIGIGQYLYKTFSESDPDNILLIEGDTDRKVNIREILELTTSFSEGLRNLGFEPGDVIAIVGENKIDLCVAAFGIAMMGGVMCPIDSTYKSYEYQHLFSLIEPKCIIADWNIIETVKDALEAIGSSAKIISIGGPEEEEGDTIPFEKVFADIAPEEFTPYECQDTKSELLCLVCSSGTTGLPKAVMMTHSCLLYQLESAGTMGWKIVPILQTSFFYWISGILLLYGFACVGALRVLTKSTDPVDVMEVIQKYKVFSCVFSPSLLSSILQHPRIKEFDLSTLKIINCGGAALLKTTLDKLREEIPHCIVVQVYGLSEMSGTVCRAVPPLDVLTLGKPGMQARLRVIDTETGDPLGPGEEGEILVKSPGIMKGYYRNEEATQMAITGDGWFRTGDIGIISEDGILHLTGRAKDLLKVDAHQISPGEIEKLIGTVPGVTDVVVCGITVGENSLPMALVVRDPDTDVSEEDVMQIVNENLSEFKQLRAGVVFVDSIARTSNGKLKRREIQPIAEALYMGEPL